jgi:hypothetical protein
MSLSNLDEQESPLSGAQNETKPVVDPEAEGLPGTADDDSSAYDDTESARVADGPDPAALPADHPIGSLDYGTTPAEAATPEPLADRLDRELPEPDPYAEAADPDDPTDPANTSDRPDPGDATVEPDELDPEAGGAAAVTGVPGAGAGIPDTDVRTAASADNPSLTGTEASPDAADDGPDPDGTLTGVPGDGLVDVTGADPTAFDELDDPGSTVADRTELLATDEIPNETGVLDDNISAQWDEHQPDEVGRLLAPDEGAHPDREHTEIATDTGAAGGGLTAEEAAIHEEP